MDEAAEFVKFLIMENLPTDGKFLDIEELRNNVVYDLFSIKKHQNHFIFDTALRDLNEKQYVFISKKERKVAATQYGVIRSSAT